MKPDLISFCGGGNDLLRPGADPDRVAKTLARAVRELRRTGAEVLLFTGVDVRDTPIMRALRGKFAVFYLHVRSIADLYGCRLVDLWSMQSLRDWRAWSEDRLHMNAEGHRRVAARVLDVLGVDVRGRLAQAVAAAASRWTRGCGGARTSAGCASTWCRGSAGGCAARRRATGCSRSARSRSPTSRDRLTPRARRGRLGGVPARAHHSRRRPCGSRSSSCGCRSPPVYAGSAAG